MTPGIVIVMRSFNEQPHAARTIAALATQTLKGFALDAVDSGSTDGSIEAVAAAHPRRIERIPPGSYVPGAVLNRMIDAATEPLIVLLNADGVPSHPEWLERLVAPLLAGEADATFSRQVPRPDALFIVADDYLRAYHPGNLKDDNADFFSAVACAFRRTLWEAHRFPETGYAEDLAWARECRLHGARFRLVADSVVEHSHNYTLAQLHRKKFRHGQTYARLYGRRPCLLRQSAACLREMARDFLRATTSGRISTLPYNLAYRAVIHAAFHAGLKDATARSKHPQPP